MGLQEYKPQIKHNMVTVMCKAHNVNERKSGNHLVINYIL